MGPKYSRFDLQSTLAGQHHQVIEQAAALLRWGRGRKPGSEALGCVGCQGELRHQQQFAADLGDIEVHPAVIVGENPILEHAGQQSRCRQFVVLWFDPDEGQQSGSNSTNGMAVDVNLGIGYALQQGNHAETRISRNIAIGWAILSGSKTRFSKVEISVELSQKVSI
jgi:hypothetical protein